MDETLAAELKAMVAEDQRIRRPSPGQEKRFAVPLSPEETMEWRRVDVANTDRLREIVEHHGWPGRSLVGEEGAEHAWLLAQHADRQLDFQRQALRLLADAVERGEATRRQLAYLTDRVRLNEGREQLYGTQVAGIRDGCVVPWPVEGPAQLDARRAEVGLEPFEEYAGHFRDLEPGVGVSPAPINHLAIAVSDQARSRAFYETYFGFGARPARRYDDGVLMLYNDSGFALALRPTSEPPARPTWMHFGVGLPTRQAVLELHNRLIDDRVELVEESEEPEYVSVKCRDPDGYIVEGFWEPQ